MEIDLGIGPWEYQGVIPPDESDHWYDDDITNNSQKQKLVARRAQKIDHK